MKLRLVTVIFALVVPLAACSPRKKTESAVSTPSSQTQLSSDSQTSTWYNYVSADGSYSVNFPAKPEESSQSANLAAGDVEYKLVSYDDKKQQRNYTATVAGIPLPPGANTNKLDPDKILDASRDGFAKSSLSNVTSETKINLNGYPGREVIFRGENNLAIKGRFFINANTPKIYQVIVGDSSGNIDFPEAQTFLDSFAIKN
jgi:PsbP-like protein